MRSNYLPREIHPAHLLDILIPKENRHLVPGTIFCHGTGP